jgi:Carboxypeptidase regulatory-like domain
MSRFVVSALFVCLILSALCFGQSTSATVSGTVADFSGAVMPGVSVTATNNATGVVTTVVSNEAGAYNIASLLPGVYKITAELPGFQIKTYTDVQLGNADRVRLNFTLQVASQSQSVEVTVAADTLLATSSSSVGEVLSQTRVQDLPTVSNNVLDLYRLMPGIRVNDDGVSGSFAGLSSFGTVNMQRDGVDAAGGSRWGSNALSATYMSPDLIGEARLIVAPVDAEMGRGNAQIQFLTRSGTNQFHGSGAWFVRNSALDANTWNNNKQVDPKTGAWKPTQPDWSNNHQLTGSIGGPIVKNKTFFFALWDSLLVNGRTQPNSIVLTPCARRGIFRYWDTGSTLTTNMWNNGNAIQPTASGTTPTIAVVDGLGNPLRPEKNPDGTPFTGTLRYFSVFGPLAANPSQPDCSDATVQGSPWDSNRTRMDPTGFVANLLAKMPLPNNYEAIQNPGMPTQILSDGLNTAGFRWTRNENSGTESIFGTNTAGIATLAGLGRKQINTKIDHNFNSRNKLGVSYTYERSAGNANYETWPGGFRGSVFRHPQTLAVNFTTTLSSNLVNEVRVGNRRIGGNTFNGLNNPKGGSEAQTFFPNYGGYPVVFALGVGGTGTVNFQSNQPLGGGSTSAYNDITNLLTYGDSLSWTTGKHAFKFGGEFRNGHSLGYDAGITVTSIPRGTGGDAPLAAIPTPAISPTNMAGLGGSAATGNNQRMRNLLSFLSGSLASVTQFYYMQSPTKLDAFETYKTFPQRIRDTHQNEASAFFKDDWKVSKSLTLNLGLRWDYYGVPYDGYGLMPLTVGGPSRIFGISGDSNGWFVPGVRGDLTSVEFVGKNSPKPGTSWYPNDWNNFGPAIGFAWQLPWFGAGKTTIRGGYQMTYNAGQVSNAITQENNVPSSTLNATYAGDSVNTYLDLTKVASLVPVTPIITPMQPTPITDRSQQIYNPQPGLVNPYAQDVTLAITRSITSNVTVDLRYIGTLGRKQWNAAFQLNSPNFLTNGLKEAFDAARAGDDSNPNLQVLERMFRGINIAGAGPVGQTVSGVLQTAGAHLRASTATATGIPGNLQTNLANGNYANVAAILNVMNYSSTTNSTLPVIPAGRNGEVLRFSGLFPENFIVTNPQYSSVFMIANANSNNYHSLEAQVTLRPLHGLTMQSTYTWSKNLGINWAVGSQYTNPLDRQGDYAVLADNRTHDFRTNGSLLLPVGPGKFLLSNSHGILARIVEGWQAGWIVNLNSGQPMTITGQNTLYANNTATLNAGLADVVGPFDRNGKVEWQSGATSGSYFMNGALKQVPDPQCAKIATSLQSACTLNAIADANTGQILLQNPQPGTRGNLGLRSIEVAGRWRFDANATKSIKLAESKTLQFRLDATDVFNHAEPATPVLDINTANFGLITGTNAKSTLHRQFQASLRFMF